MVFTANALLCFIVVLFFFPEVRLSFPNHLNLVVLISMQTTGLSLEEIPKLFGDDVAIANLDEFDANEDMIKDLREVEGKA